ncbi:unnamed protein product [Urochloa decumbens]|uniref:KIB1-4 beta-propeller domain-containing protein n=1 Tax=Urochloa decumbens TaxID=240449 RepID=A0ABC9B3T4_9POAL
MNSGKVSVYSANPSSERLRVEYEYAPVPAGFDDDEQEEDAYDSSPGDDVIAVLCRITHGEAVGDLVRDTPSPRASEGGAALQQLQHCLLVESACETLLFGVRDNTTVEVLRLDAARALLEPVGSLGSHSLFIGDWRCLCVDADRFPSICGNCIILHDEFPVLRVIDLAEGVEDQEVSELVHLLSDYCTNIPCSELGVEGHHKQLYQLYCQIMKNAASKDYSEYYDSDD